MGYVPPKRQIDLQPITRRYIPEYMYDFKVDVAENMTYFSVLYWSELGCVYVNIVLQIYVSGERASDRKINSLCFL
jgi:hypothetical protein